MISLLKLTTLSMKTFQELKYFFETFGKFNIDVLQIRPITKLGNTEYNNFSLEKIIPQYDKIHNLLLNKSINHNVKLIAHNPKQLSNRTSIDSVINKYIYCYISPTSLFNNSFEWKKTPMKLTQKDF